MSQPTSSSYVDSLEQLKSLKKTINGLSGSLVLSTTKSNPSNYTSYYRNDRIYYEHEVYTMTIKKFGYKHQQK